MKSTIGLVIIFFAVLSYSTTVVEGSEIENNRTQQEMYNFFTEHLEELIVYNLLDSQYHPIPEVRERYEELMLRIIGNYGRAPEFAWYMSYAPASPSILNSASNAGGLPSVGLVIPAYMDAYEEMQANDALDLKNRFENSAIIGLFHELEHLAYGTSLSQSATPDELDRSEILTWAQTCQNTASIFIDKNLPIGDSYRIYCDEWENSGRSIMSRSWINFIKNTHAHLR